MCTRIVSLLLLQEMTQCISMSVLHHLFPSSVLPAPHERSAKAWTPVMTFPMVQARFQRPTAHRQLIRTHLCSRFLPEHVLAIRFDLLSTSSVCHAHTTLIPYVYPMRMLHLMEDLLADTDTPPPTRKIRAFKDIIYPYPNISAFLFNRHHRRPGREVSKTDRKELQDLLLDPRFDSKDLAGVNFDKLDKEIARSAERLGFGRKCQVSAGH